MEIRIIVMAFSLDRIIINWVLLYHLMITPAQSIEWLTMPGDVRVCQGDDVAFQWSYVPGTAGEVTSTFWFHMTDGATIISQEGNTSRVYGSYIGRAELLPNHNAGIQLRHVTTSDSGPYRVEIAATPRVQFDTSYMTVYDKASLIPSVSFGDIKLSNGDILQLTGNQLSLKILLAANQAGNITVTSQTKTNGVIRRLQCNLVSQCDVNLPFNGTGNYTANVKVEYPMCSPFNWTFHVQVQEVTDIPVNVIAIATTVSIAATVVVIAIVIVAVRCAKRQSTRKHVTEDPQSRLTPDGQSTRKHVTEDPQSRLTPDGSDDLQLSDIQEETPDIESHALMPKERTTVDSVLKDVIDGVLEGPIESVPGEIRDCGPEETGDYHPYIEEPFGASLVNWVVRKFQKTETATEVLE